MPEEIKSKINDHDVRLAVIEQRMDTAQSDIAAIKDAVRSNNALISEVRDTVVGLAGFQRGATWLLGIGIAGLGLAITYFR